MKRKEKVLTLEEIKARLIQQSAGNWLHSEPHFSLISTPEGIQVLPLSKTAESQILVVFLIDLTHYSAEGVLSTLDRFTQEYKGLPWSPVLVIEQKYLFLKDHHFFDRFRHHKSFANTPVFLDGAGDWFEHFKVEIGSVIVLNRGREVFKESLAIDFESKISKMEQLLQDGLRVEDPGLPLFEVSEHAFDQGCDLKITEAGELALTGTWASTPGSVVTEDSNAQLSFHFEGTHLRLVGISHPNSREPTRFVITLNQEPLPSSHYGSATRLGEKGSSVSEVGKSHGVYELISSTNPLRGEIRIKFLNAVENPVILYGFRAA